MFTSFRDWMHFQVPELVDDTINTKNEKMSDHQSLIKEDDPADIIVSDRTPPQKDENNSLSTIINKSDCFPIMLKDRDDCKTTEPKSFGNLLYFAINKVKTAVSDVGVMFKEIFEQQTDILEEFNKEQETFLKSRQSNTLSSFPPWLGCPNEETIKEQCLNLSNDKRNFTRGPPAGIDFEFDYEVSYPVAVTIMEQDHDLVQMRFELVPKIVSERDFWRNYFYRVGIICRAYELPLESQPDANEDDQFLRSDVKDSAADTFMVDTPDNDDLVETQHNVDHLITNCDEEWEKELEEELRNYEILDDDESLKSKTKICDQ